MNESKPPITGQGAELSQDNPRSVASEELPFVGPSASTHNAALMGLLSRQIYEAEKKGLVKAGDLIVSETPEGDVFIVDHRPAAAQMADDILTRSMEQKLKAKFWDGPKMNRADRRRMERGRRR